MWTGLKGTFEGGSADRLWVFNVWAHWAKVYRLQIKYKCQGVFGDPHQCALKNTFSFQKQRSPATWAKESPFQMWLEWCFGVQAKTRFDDSHYFKEHVMQRLYMIRASTCSSTCSSRFREGPLTWSPERRSPSKELVRLMQGKLSSDLLCRPTFRICRLRCL